MIQNPVYRRPGPFWWAAAVLLHLAVAASAAAQQPAAADRIAEVTQLPPLPDDEGFAGMYAGLSHDHLLAWGGANFPEGRPWEGGQKVWYNKLYSLNMEASASSDWEIRETSEAAAYGVCVTWKHKIIAAGGCDADQHLSSVRGYEYTPEGIQTTDLPSLPEPRAYHAGVELNSRLYIVGGTPSPTATSASSAMWSLDLQDPSTGWREEPALPGPGRLLPVTAAQGGSLLVFSGASLAADEEGKPVRTYLQDAWRFHPRTGWEAVADCPRPFVAAPSPAPVFGTSHVLLSGGDDGSRAGTNPADHTGFPRTQFFWHSITNTWIAASPLPDSVRPPVTVPVVQDADRFLLISGEVSPGIRTPAVWALSIPEGAANFGLINWGVVALYLAGMIGVAWMMMKREAAATTDGYFRGGQRIPGWVAGLSIFATMLSSLTFMGIPARAYATDISWYLGQLTILIVVPIVVVFYLPRFRSLNVTSAYEYLEQRFSVVLRVIASLLFMMFHIGRIAIVLFLPSLALSAVSDISVNTAILTIGILCLIYTIMGGITAVVWTDAVQAVVLMTGAVICFAAAVIPVEGGFTEILETARSDGKLMQSVDWIGWNIGPETQSAWILVLAFGMNSLVSYTSSQDVVQRYVTTPDLASARRSLWITMWMSVFGSLVFFLLGTAIYSYYRAFPEQLDPTLPQTDSILPFYILQRLPTGISGLVIAAIFAASQSTVSSSLNSIAAAWTTDIDRRLLRPHADDAALLRSSRLVVLVVGAVGIGAALMMAQGQVDSAFKTFNEFIGLAAGSLGGLFALGIFVRRAHARGALAGAVTGTTLVAGLKFLNAPVSGLLFALIGFTICVLVGATASLLLPDGRPKSTAASNTAPPD